MKRRPFTREELFDLKLDLVLGLADPALVAAAIDQAIAQLPQVTPSNRPRSSAFDLAALVGALTQDHGLTMRQAIEAAEPGATEDDFERIKTRVGQLRRWMRKTGETIEVRKRDIDAALRLRRGK